MGDRGRYLAAPALRARYLLGLLEGVLDPEDPLPELPVLLLPELPDLLAPELLPDGLPELAALPDSLPEPFPELFPDPLPEPFPDELDEPSAGLLPPAFSPCLAPPPLLP
jgi:hypothetical protein